MNYTSLKTNIEDICETSFTDAQLALFTQQAEEKILQTVDIPAYVKWMTVLWCLQINCIRYQQTTYTRTAYRS